MAAEQKGKPAGGGAADDVAAVIGLLPRVVRGRPFDPEKIRVHFGERDPGGHAPAVAYCQVDIKGDTTADRDKIKAKFPAKEGWTCKNTGDKTATCTNP